MIQSPGHDCGCTVRCPLDNLSFELPYAARHMRRHRQHRANRDNDRTLGHGRRHHRPSHRGKVSLTGPAWTVWANA